MIAFFHHNPHYPRQIRQAQKNSGNFLTLESANIKMGDVVSDVMGVSSREILAAIVAGQADPGVMAELSRGKMQHKREQLTQALTGSVKAHHRFVLSEL